MRRDTHAAMLEGALLAALPCVALLATAEVLVGLIDALTRWHRGGDDAVRLLVVGFVVGSAARALGRWPSDGRWTVGVLGGLLYWCTATALAAAFDPSGDWSDRVRFMLPLTAAVLAVLVAAFSWSVKNRAERRPCFGLAGAVTAGAAVPLYGLLRWLDAATALRVFVPLLLLTVAAALLGSEAMRGSASAPVRVAVAGVAGALLLFVCFA